VGLTPTAVEALKRHSKRQAQEMVRADTIYQDQDLVFASLVGTSLSRRNLTRSFKALLKRTGLPHTVRFHDLQRRTCATLLLSQDTHPKFVQELLDHATIAVTLDTYSQVMPGMADHTVAMENALSEPVSVKLMSKGPDERPGLSHFPLICRNYRRGGTRTRTGDTMIFSHVRCVSGCCWRFQRRLS
jgi:hypothetical protein